MSIDSGYITSITLSSATNRSNVLVNTAATNKLNTVLPARLVGEQLEVALADLSFPINYSNVSAAYQNQTGLSYTWIDGTGPYPITLPEGYYNAATLSTYIQQVMQNNGHCLTPTNPASGLPNLFYISLSLDAAWGNRTIVAITPVPSSLPAGYQIGTGAAPAWTLPSQPTTPQLTLAPAATDIYGNPAKYWLGALLGLPAGSYPATVLNAAYSTLAPSLPAQPVAQVSVLLDQASNPWQHGDNRLLYSFPITAPYEGVQRETPPALRPVLLGQNNVCELTLSFVDQNGLPVPMGGPLSATLMFFARPWCRALP